MEGKKNQNWKAKKKNQNRKEKKNGFHVSLSGGTKIQVEIKIYTKYIDESGKKKKKQRSGKK